MSHQFVSAPIENWRAVPDTDGRYEVSDLGRVRRRTADGTIPILPHRYGPGYLGVTVASRSRYVHELVALAFLGPRPDGYEVDHVDGHRQNNKATNLEWVTPGQNQRRAYDLGLKASTQGEQHHLARLTEDDVRLIRSDPTVRDVKYAERFGVHENTTINVRTRRTWRHLS
jgi:hypothetical protein